jgi:hypothetical protein
MIQPIAERARSRILEDVLTTATQGESAIGIAAIRSSTYPQDVSTRIRDLQQTSLAIARDLQRAKASGQTQEATRLALKLKSIDNSAAAIARRAARSIGKDRRQSIATLNAIFAQGMAPAQPLSGDYRGELLTTTVWTPLDAFARLMSKLYFPWLGKRFDPEASTGDNIFLPSARFAGHLVWPLYFGYKPYRDGFYTGFTFATFTGPGVQDPGLTTLKLDYDHPDNPGFLVQTVLDEVVQITHNYYLGKAFLWRSEGFRLAAFFALRPEVRSEK